jgi:hypothetical protein
MIAGIPSIGIAHALKRGSEEFVASRASTDDWLDGFRMPECFDVIEIELIPRAGFADWIKLFTTLGGKSTIYAT